MMRIACYVLTCCSLVFCSLSAKADNPLSREREERQRETRERLETRASERYFGPSVTYYNNPYYKKEAQEVFAHQFDPDFNFNDLRRYYAKTTQYDPLADATRQKLYDISYRVIHGEDPEDVQKALEEFSDILRDHLGNVNVVALATSLAREDSRFGDPKFYQWITQGIMKVVKRQGDGSSFEDAYYIVATDEEDLLLRALNVTALSTELIPYGPRYYNLYMVRDNETGKERELFLDVTLPLARAQYLHDQTGREIDLSR